MLVPKLRFKREDGTDYPEWEEKILQDVSSYITTTGIGEKSVYVGTENMRKDCSGVVLEDNNDTTVKGIQYALNDVLVSNIRPYLKKAWKADRSGICSTDVLCIRGTSDILNEYLYTLLSSDSFFEYVMQGVKGTKMPRGDKKHIMDMPVSIPCLEEQQKIADFLSAVDEVIAQSEEEVQNLEQQKKASMQKVFSQEARFKREDGTDYPEWESVSFGSLIIEYRHRTLVENEDVLLSSAINGMFLNTELFGHQRGKSNIGYLKIDYGTLILSAQNLHLGNANVNLRFEHGIISPAYKTYHITNCNVFFMAQWIKREETNQFFYDATTVGASQCRRNVDWNALYEQRILLPNIEEQQKIADFLSAYDEAISYAKKELDKWKKLKKGLLQQMFV